MPLNLPQPEATDLTHPEAQQSHDLDHAMVAVADGDMGIDDPQQPVKVFWSEVGDAAVALDAGRLDAEGRVMGNDPFLHEEGEKGANDGNLPGDRGRGTTCQGVAVVEDMLDGQVRSLDPSMIHKPAQFTSVGSGRMRRYLVGGEQGNMTGHIAHNILIIND